MLNMVDFLTNTIHDISSFYDSESKSFTSNSWIQFEIYE